MSKYNNLPRVPLHFQGIKKAGPQSNPSWESARRHQIHNVDYNYQGQDRPNTHMMSIIRRNPDGTLDYQWAKNMVLDAVHNMSYPHALLPIHQALLGVIFPGTNGAMEPMQADLMTQFSTIEKQRVRQLVESQLEEEENWNAGNGGGSVEGRTKMRDGTP